MPVATTQEANYVVKGKFKDGISGPSKKAFSQFQQRATAAFKATAIAIGVVTVALGRMLSKTLDTFDAIGKSADRIGITTDALQEYRFALDKAGISQEQTDKGLLEFEKRFGKAQAGFGALAESLKRVDAELLENVLAAGDGTAALEVLFEALGETTDKAKQLAIADAAFGKVGLKMTAAFKDGTVSFKEWINTARESGAIISEELIRKAENLNDEMSALGTVMKVSFQSGLIEGFVDEFGGLHEMIVDPNFREGLTTIGEFMGGFLKFLVENAKPIAITSASLAALFLASNIAGAVGLKGRLGGILALLSAVTAGILVFNEFAEASENSLKKADDATMTFRMNVGSLKEETEELTDEFTNFGDSIGLLSTFFVSTIGTMENETRSFIDSSIAGINDYGESVGTIADQTQRAFARSFQSMEDGLVEFAKTGKFNFSNFIDSIISDLIRFQIQQSITLPLANFASNFLGSLGGNGGVNFLNPGETIDDFISPPLRPDQILGFDGARAHGGPVHAGGSFLVGERGPEIFSPSSNGNIIANDRISPNVNIQIINQANAQVQAEQTQNDNGGLDLKFLITEIVSNDINNDGPINASIRSNFTTNVRSFKR